MTREDIIREIARTLFVCAYADGVESGEITGPKAGPGEDWMDVAPRSYRCSECRFAWTDYVLAGKVYKGRPCVECYGDSALVVEEADPDAEREARQIVDAFEKSVTDQRKMAYLGFDEHLKKVGAEGWTRPETGPIEHAARIHKELSGTDRFSHCLAMTALGHGVGIEDDLPPGVSLPGWIRASIPRSDFGPWSLHRG